jgi:hypothetical protein
MRICGDRFAGELSHLIFRVKEQPANAGPGLTGASLGQVTDRGQAEKETDFTALGHSG